MKLFLDTANLADIQQAAATGLLDGVTTNPTLIVKSGQDFTTTIRSICELVDGPVSAEVTVSDSAGMVNQGTSLAKIHRNVVVKVPMTGEGLLACQALRRRKIQVNVTLIFTPTQALLAAKAGATFVSPFAGRLDDIGEDSVKMIAEIRQMYDQYCFSTQILFASVRSIAHVKEAALMGCDAVTMPPDIFHALFTHKLTDKGLKKFAADWAAVKNKK